MGNKTTIGEHEAQENTASHRRSEHHGQQNATLNLDDISPAEALDLARLVKAVLAVLPAVPGALDHGLRRRFELVAAQLSAKRDEADG